MASELQAGPASTRLHEHVRRAVRWFLAGVSTIPPVAITAWVAGLIHRLVGPGTPVGDFLRRFGLRFVSDDAMAYVLGAVILLAMIFLIGVIAEFGARNLIQRLVDAVLQRHGRYG